MYQFNFRVLNTYTSTLNQIVLSCEEKSYSESKLKIFNDYRFNSPIFKNLNE